jgi:alpha-amylase
MKVSETEEFKYTTTPASSNKVAIWDSSDPTIASVTNGKVLALSKGTATITCTVDNVPAKLIVRVK